MDWSIYRPHTSTYQAQDFCQAEEKRLRQLSAGVAYGLPTDDEAQERPIILITNTQTRLEELPAAVAKNIQLIIHPNSGHDNLSRSWAQERGIPVVLGNPIRAPAVAEYVLSCLFHRFADLPLSLAWNQQRSWPRQLLKEQRVQLIGLGHIGRRLLPQLQTLCKEVSVYDPPQGHFNLRLQEQDVVILACDLNPSSYRLLGSAFLSQLPTHVTIINPARGELMDEALVLDFLRQNPCARAYLDVYSIEPYPGNFPSLPNLFCTSHQAGVFAELDEKILQFEEAVVRDFLTLPRQEFRERYHQQLLEHRPNYERMERV